MTSASQVLTRNCRNEIQKLANAWLATGAKRVALVQSGRVLQVFGASDCEFTHCHELSMGKRDSVQFCICIDDLPQHRARLDADMALLQRILDAETEFDEMTTELVNYQDQLLAMYDLGRIPRAYIDMPSMMDSFVKESAKLMGAESAVILLELPDEPLFISQYPETRPLRDFGMELLSVVRGTGRYFIQRENLPSSFFNVLMIPIQVKGDYRAALGFFDRAWGFESPQIKLAEAIAEQVGERIESVLLYQESLNQSRLETEMELAYQVQQKLLPRKLPTVEGIDIFATSRAALQVGGDFFDFMPRDNHDLLFTLGDVTGKGISAAIVMAMMRTVIHSVTHSQVEQTPAKIIEQINEQIYDDFTEIGVFTTLFFGNYRPDTGTLTYANAGHSPVIYRPSGGKAKLLEADGTAVGILPYSFSENHTLQLNTGDVLVVATDGFSEGFDSSGKMFGYDRLCYMVDTLSQRPAQGIVSTMLKTLAWFSSGTQQSDDQTILVIKKL